MARKPSGNPTGRPIKEIDWTSFENLCGLHCTQSEIAAFLKIHHETLIYKVEEKYGEPFASVYKKYQESGKCSLRRNQFAMSKTNASMAIWLGKQYLGQRDLEIQSFGTTEQKQNHDSLFKQIANLQASLQRNIEDKTNINESKS